VSDILHPEQRRRFLTAKTRELIAACGGIEAAAEITNRSSSTVGRWQDFNGNDLAPMECIAAMEAVTGVPIVSLALARAPARAPAHVFAPARARAREDCVTAFADLNERAGRLNTGLMLALQDGEVSAGEVQTLSKTAGQVRAVLDRMEHALHAAVTPRPVQDGEAI
jgi:hypothetical protein